MQFIPLARHDAKKIINDPWIIQEASNKHLGKNLRANLTYYNHASWLKKLFFELSMYLTISKLQKKMKVKNPKLQVACVF